LKDPFPFTVVLLTGNVFQIVFYPAKISSTQILKICGQNNNTEWCCLLFKIYHSKAAIK